jgi:hypothetical protein
MSALAFLDESGDESGKLDRGASRLFVVGLVVFPDRAEAERCRARIEQLVRELGKPARYEFHFRPNTHAVRMAFLEAIAPFAFTYYAVVLEKPETPTAHLPLYLNACARACSLAGASLDRAHLTVDMRDTEKMARDRMAADLRRYVNRPAGRTVLGRVRARSSGSERLVQLADYVAGVARWREEGRRGADAYARPLAPRKGQQVRMRV